MSEKIYGVTKVPWQDPPRCAFGNIHPKFKVSGDDFARCFGGNSKGKLALPTAISRL
jgi:hypothetical protein